MDKIDSIPPSLTSFPASVPGPEPAHRLIVLVPDLEWDYIPAIHRIWELAYAQCAHVLLLSLSKDPRQELSLRRALATLSAMTQDGRIPVEASVEIGMNWLSAVKRNYRTGDTIVCFAEKPTGLLHKPLSQILQSNLNIPVYVLADLFSQKPKLNWFSHVIAWSGFIGIILGFCILQVRIIQLPADWFQNVSLILSIIPEFWLICVWNNRFG
jgi:hypothetical protein